MAVSVSTEGVFTAGRPQQLFEFSGVGGGSLQYDVSAAGQRFVTIAPVEGEEAAPPKIRVVQNWYEEFRDREQ
jgi:hypothetical protein